MSSLSPATNIYDSIVDENRVKDLYGLLMYIKMKGGETPRGSERDRVLRKMLNAPRESVYLEPEDHQRIKFSILEYDGFSG